MSQGGCGVLGVGSLGSAIAERLAHSGFDVHAYDLDPTRIEELESLGVRRADSPRALAEACETVLVLLPDTPDILACLNGTDGLDVGLGPGSALLIASTVLPGTPQDLAERLSPRSVAVLDCPVSGGPVAARQGELAIMVGGEPGEYERCRPVLEAIGQPVHVGPVGHGEIAKLANNLMGSVIALGIAEGLALAAKAGADLDRVREAIEGGSGASWILSSWMPRTVLAGRTEADFAVRLMAKDMALLEHFAAELNVPLRAGKLAQQTFGELLERGFGERDFSVVVGVRAQEAGAPWPGPR